MIAQKNKLNLLAIIALTISVVCLVIISLLYVVQTRSMAHMRSFASVNHVKYETPPTVGKELLSQDEQHYQANMPFIQVSGSAEISTQPNLVRIILGYENINKDAEQAQQDNADVMNDIINALKTYVSKDNIETYNYELSRHMEWQDRRYVDKGYKVRHTIIISIDDIDKIGKVIDTAIQHKANIVQGIQFTLDKETEKELQKQALAKALEDAMNKAQILADQAGIKLGDFLSITESSSNIRPFYTSYDLRGLAVQGAGATLEKASSNIPSRNVKITAQVSAIIKIK